MRFIDTRIISAGEKGGIEIAARLIREGGLVAFPTETVYGLGANVFDERAVRKIYRVKGRPTDNPMIVHVASVRQGEQLLQSVPAAFHALAEAFWPGPLSLICYRNASVPHIVTAGLPKVALRIPDHPLTRRLIRAAGVPLVAPSANRSGSPSPTSAEDVHHDLDGRIEAIIDGGKCRIGIESTVLDLTGTYPVILRPGKIDAHDVARITGGRVSIARHSVRRPASPGMKYVHYAPVAELVLFEGVKGAVKERMRNYCAWQKTRGRKVGLLAPVAYRIGEADSFFALGRGTPLEYARGIYQGMRVLDQERVHLILCPSIPEKGLGAAVMNRLKKAARRTIILPV